MNPYSWPLGRRMNARWEIPLTGMNIIPVVRVTHPTLPPGKGQEGRTKGANRERIISCSRGSAERGSVGCVTRTS